MNHPIPIVHKSHLITAKMCMKMLEYKDIFKLPEPYVRESALLGIALHDSIQWLHEEAKRNKKPWDNDLSNLAVWNSRFMRKLNELKEKKLSQGIEVIDKKNADIMDHLEMLAGYMDKPYNRYAEPILMEKSFRFYIQNGTDKRIVKYQFEGTIDQLFRIECKYLEEYGDLEVNYDSPLVKDKKVYIHRDIKTGEKSAAYTDIEFNDDINVYSVGLRDGLFDLSGNGIFDKQIGLIPYAHCLYFIQDHKVYKRAYGKYKAGDERGNGMYYAFRNYDEIELVKKELLTSWKYVNNGNYPRTGAMAGTCESMCTYKDFCIKQFKGRLAI